MGSKRLVVKLNFLTVIGPNIAYHVIVISWFISDPYTSYWDVIRILQYLKSAQKKCLL